MTALYSLSTSMLPDFLYRQKCQRLLTALCIMAVTSYGIILLYLRKPVLRDFDLHRDIGRWFLTGQNLYTNPFTYPYMPTGAMYFSLLAMVDRTVGLALRYMTAIICLWLTCVLFHRMIRDRFKELYQANLILSVFAIVLAGQFILYDLDDGGPQTILMGILVGAIYAVWKGREKFGAIGFGLAIALKVTPGLFLPFFMWKRQWRLALYTAVATACWIVLPIVWMGPASWWAHQKTWTQVAAGSAVGYKTPIADANEDNIRNLGIQPALMHYLVTLSPDHPQRQNDPGYVAILNLPPTLAHTLVVSTIIVLLIGFCRYTRRPYGGPGDPEWPRECSGLLIFMLLLSPVTWIQHLPWLVPALYWIVAKACSHDGLSQLSKVAMGLYALIAVVLNYEILGKKNFTAFLSFKPFTMGMLLIFAVLMLQSKNSRSFSHSPAHTTVDVK
jgi:alpha-1,2-mannosyltransferase